MKAHEILTRIRVEEALKEGLASKSLRHARPSVKRGLFQKLLQRIFHTSPPHPTNQAENEKTLPIPFQSK